MVGLPSEQPFFVREDGGWWHTLVLGKNFEYEIGFRLTPPHEATSIEDSVINSAPELVNRKTMDVIAVKKGMW